MALSKRARRSILAVSIVLILVAGLLVYANYFLGPTLKAAIEKLGPGITGTPVQVERISIFPLRGRVNVHALVVGNPDGFTSESLMEMGDFVLDIRPLSVFTDTLVIQEIQIAGPLITYERSRKQSNLSVVMDTLKGKKPPPSAPPRDSPPEKEKPPSGKTPEKKKAGRNVVIERVVITQGKVRVVVPMLGGQALGLDLPDIALTDIGNGTSGQSVNETVTLIIQEILKTVSGAVGGSVKGGGTGGVGRHSPAGPQ